MNLPLIDDQPFPELEGLGRDLRHQGHARVGDLGTVRRRSHARSVRQRSAVMAAGIATVVGVAALASGRDGGNVQTATSPPAELPLPTSEVEPGWTVNPSIPMDTLDPVWTLRVRYDPEVYDFSSFGEEVQRLAFESRQWGPDAMINGGAETHGTHVHDSYAIGAGAEGLLRTVREQLLRRPGVLSAEVGLATPTRLTPATPPLGTAPLVATPTGT